MERHVLKALPEFSPPGPWSAILAFAFFALATPASSNNPPNEPTAEDPLNGETGEWLCTALRWSGTDPDGDSVMYDVYFGPTSPPPLVSSNQSGDVYILPGLQTSTTYRWRIVVRDEHGAERTGPEWYFTTKATNLPPTVPSSPSPPIFSTDVPVTANLSWYSADLDGGCDLTYDVYFGTISSVVLVATLVDETEYDPGPLNFLTTYYWRIVARDHLGLETSSPPLWFFKTKANSAPNAPSNPHPLNGNAGSTTTLLTWTCTDVDAQPLLYMVYFGDSFPLPLVATLIPDASFDPGPLQPGVTYHWIVVAYDGFLYTPAPAWSFVARVPGDVVADHELTAADAACAMQVYLVNPDCGGPGAYIMADVNCDGNVTPGDARCIHREVLGLGCDICQDAVTPPATAEPSVFPVVSLSSWLIDGGTLIVRLGASGVDELNAFGLYTWASPNVPLLNAEPRGASSHFDVWERRQVSPQFAYVGGYALADQLLGADGEFIELHYDISGGMPNSIGIDGFVDDLAGALQLYLPLHTMVDVGPIPTQLTLHQNYPNPFNPLTTIAYDLPATQMAGRVTLRIVDVTGRVVRTLVDENQSGGRYRIAWEGKDDRGESVSSGIYFSVLDARGTRHTRKLVLLK